MEISTEVFVSDLVKFGVTALGGESKDDCGKNDAIVISSRGEDGLCFTKAVSNESNSSILLNLNSIK